MKTTLAALLLVGLAAGCSGTATDGTSAPSPAPADASAAEAAPAFSLPSLGGETVSLEGLRGKVVILAFWDTH